MNEEKTDLDKVLDHEKWLMDPKTKQNPDLRGADLNGADLSRANLRGADLNGADLSRADLRGADLNGADLSRADLYKANLRGADLNGAELHKANLRGANLRGANLSRAIFNFAKIEDCEGIKVILRDPRLDERYILITWYLDGKPWFNAGCRSFSKVDALAHWGSENYEDPRRGKLYVDAIEAFDLNK